MNYVRWLFRQAQILTLILTKLLNLVLIYLVRVQESHERKGCGNHQGHLQRKREVDVMKMKEQKEEAAVE